MTFNSTTHYIWFLQASSAQKIDFGRDDPGHGPCYGSLRCSPRSPVGWEKPVGL